MYGRTPAPGGLGIDDRIKIKRAYATESSVNFFINITNIFQICDKYTLMNLKHRAIILKKNGLKISSIAESIGKSERTVNRYTQDIPHPNLGLKNLPKTAILLSKEKAELLGFLAAEGTDYVSTDNHWEFHKNRGKFYKRERKRSFIEFSNTNDIILERFVYLLDRVYCYRPSIKKNGNIRIRRIKVMNDLRRYSKFGSHKWSVPKSMLTSNVWLKGLYCRGYFDGDGTVETHKKEVRFDSVNYNGLLGIKSLLDSLGIKSSL